MKRPNFASRNHWRRFSFAASPPGARVVSAARKQSATAAGTRSAATRTSFDVLFPQSSRILGNSSRQQRAADGGPLVPKRPGERAVALDGRLPRDDAPGLGHLSAEADEIAARALAGPGPDQPS